MKRLILPLLAALALPTGVNAEVNPKVHNLCKDVSDYMGCVKANSKNNSWNPFKAKTFNIKSNNYKEAKLDVKKVEERCAIGRKTSMSQGKIGIIENYESCLKYLKEIGATSLDIPFKVHQKCENLLFYNKKVEPYLYCVSNKTTWEPPTKYSRDEIVKSYKKYSCEYEDTFSIAPSGVWDGSSCLRNKEKDIFVHRGKSYIASQSCPDGQNTYWWISGLFKKKVTELGCMTPEQSKLVKKNKNNSLNQVNQRNFNQMLKRNETTGIRTYQPNYQPYGNVYGTSGQYGAGGY